MSGAPNTGARVGYVLTHYPKLAQTFIANEIEAVERAGTPVRVFAMNAPDAGETARPGADTKAARTTYLKPTMARAVGELLSATLRHPLAMAGVAYAIGYFFAKCNGLKNFDARAICMETGIQNAGLGLVIILNFFPESGGMLLLVAWWSVWNLISAMTLAGWWRWSGAMAQK